MTVLRDIPPPPMREGALQMQVPQLIIMTMWVESGWVGSMGLSWREGCLDAYSS